MRSPVVKSSFPCVKTSPRVTGALLRATALLCSRIPVRVFASLWEGLLRAERRGSGRRRWRDVAMGYELLVDRCVLHWPIEANLALRERCLSWRRRDRWVGARIVARGGSNRRRFMTRKCLWLLLLLLRWEERTVVLGRISRMRRLRMLLR